MTRRLYPPRRTPEEYRAHYIKLTASLINRSVEYTKDLLADWPTAKIVKRYNEAMWYGMSAKPAPDVKWWAARKREVTNTSSTHL